MQGSAGAAGKSISTLYPQIYWETNNPYGYDIHLVPGAFVTPRFECLCQCLCDWCP